MSERVPVFAALDLTRTTIPIRSRLPPRLHETDEFGGVLEGHEQHGGTPCRLDRVRQQLLKIRCLCHAPIPPHDRSTDGAIIPEALARRHGGETALIGSTHQAVGGLPPIFAASSRGPPIRLSCHPIFSQSKHPSPVAWPHEDHHRPGQQHPAASVRHRSAHSGRSHASNTANWQQRIGNLSSRSTLRRSGLRAYYTPRASAPMGRIKIPVVPQPSRIVVERARHKNAKSDEFVRHEIR